MILLKALATKTVATVKKEIKDKSNDDLSELYDEAEYDVALEEMMAAGSSEAGSSEGPSGTTAEASSSSIGISSHNKPTLSKLTGDGCFDTWKELVTLWRRDLRTMGMAEMISDFLADKILLG